MKVDIDTEHKHACVVHSSDIKKLWKLLENDVGTVTARIKCSDDATREFDELEKLTSYENSPAKQIVSLYIESHSGDRKKSVDIRFSNDEFSIIDIRIKAQEPLASEIRGRISDILDGTKPQYNYLALKNISPFARIVIGIIASGISVIAALYIWEDFWEFESVRRLIIIAALTTWFLMGLSWLKRRLLPLCFFALGQGERRYRRLVTRQTTIFGLLATLIITLVAASIL